MQGATQQRTLYTATVPHGMVIEVLGADAAKVANNLCTNDIAKLAEGASCETFVTDLKGWVVAHGVLGKLPDRILLTGLHVDTARVAAHIDRYIIREDAEVADRSQELAVLVLDGNDLEPLWRAPGTEFSPGAAVETLLGDTPAVLLAARITSAQSLFLACPRDRLERLNERLVADGFRLGTAEEFEQARISQAWPLSGREVLEKTLPQELDRDAVAISFTKGCYLGQETIARLDARGQLQKKLCRVQIVDGAPPLISQIPAGIGGEEKPDGQLISVWQDPATGEGMGLAVLRRGHFHVGNELECDGATLRVLESPLSGV